MNQIEREDAWSKGNRRPEVRRFIISASLDLSSLQFNAQAHIHLSKMKTMLDEDLNLKRTPEDRQDSNPIPSLVYLAHAIPSYAEGDRSSHSS